MIKILAFLVAVCSLVGCSSGPTHNSLHSVSSVGVKAEVINYYPFHDVSVIDGDTVDGDLELGFGILLTDQRVRLLGIDTPETRTRDLEEKRAGLESKRVVVEKIRNADEVWLGVETGQKPDSFGRILGVVWVDGLNLNEYLLENGLAEPFLP